jgi:hypothetical protein
MKKPHRDVSKNRRDIGEVVFPIEQMLAARDMSSCCVGVEAMLEDNAPSIRQRVKDLISSRRVK